MNILEKVLFSIEQAGEELAEKGSVSKAILATISGDFNIPKEKWRQQTNLNF